MYADYTIVSVLCRVGCKPQLNQSMWHGLPPTLSWSLRWSSWWSRQHQQQPPLTRSDQVSA